METLTGVGKKDLPDLINSVAELNLAKDIQSKTPPELEESAGNGTSIQLSTGSIASKLGCDSGTELALAAAAHLTLVRNVEVFSRKVLYEEMKTAKSYFKSNYSKNLSKIIKTLMKTEINEPSTGNYALTAKSREELRSKLA
jgi:hypothetical protein